MAGVEAASLQNAALPAPPRKEKIMSSAITGRDFLRKLPSQLRWPTPGLLAATQPLMAPTNGCAWALSAAVAWQAAIWPAC